MNKLFLDSDLAKAIHEMFSTEARERIGPARIRRKRKARATNSGPSEPELVTEDNSDSDEQPPVAEG